MVNDKSWLDIGIPALSGTALENEILSASGCVGSRHLVGEVGVDGRNYNLAPFREALITAEPSHHYPFFGSELGGSTSRIVVASGTHDVVVVRCSGFSVSVIIVIDVIEIGKSLGV